jgi:hypothetical protein
LQYTQGSAQRVQALYFVLGGWLEVTCPERPERITGSLILPAVVASDQATACMLESRHSLSYSRGETPVLQADEARALIDAIDTDSLPGLRDRALIA